MLPVILGGGRINPFLASRVGKPWHLRASVGMGHVCVSLTPVELCFPVNVYAPGGFTVVPM